MIKRSAISEAIPEAGPASWSDAGIEVLEGADRLAPEQPDRGLLWVTRGSLTLTRADRIHEVRKGTVVAYRLGGGLAWSAPEGTHVRWCARDVGVGPGDVAPWTSDLALGGPLPAASKRRPLFVVAMVAVAWLFAVGVAWCYDKTHSEFLKAQWGTGPDSHSPQFAGRPEAETVRGIFLAHGIVVEFHKSTKPGRFALITSVPSDADLPRRLIAAGAAAVEVYASVEGVQKITLRLTSDPSGEVEERPDRFFLLPPTGDAIDFWPKPDAATLWESAAAPRHVSPK